jgi:hypothetical protein
MIMIEGEPGEVSSGEPGKILNGRRFRRLQVNATSSHNCQETHAVGNRKDN